MNTILVNCEYCGGTGDCSDEEYESVDCDYCEGTGCVECDPDICICAATSPTECMCGAWYEEDLDDWYDEDC